MKKSSLTLFRKPGKKFHIFIDGEEVEVEVASIRSGEARLIVRASDSVRIEREERLDG